MGEEHDHHRHDHDEHDHDDHDHTEPPAEVALRVKALETLLTARGYVSTEALDAVVDMFETKVGPRNGARVVARAWTDPAYRQRLLDSPTAAQVGGAASVGSGDGSGPWALATVAAMASKAGTSTSPPLEIGPADTVGVPPDVVRPGWRRYR